MIECVRIIDDLFLWNKIHIIVVWAINKSITNIEAITPVLGLPNAPSFPVV